MQTKVNARQSCFYLCLGLWEAPVYNSVSMVEELEHSAQATDTGVRKGQEVICSRNDI